MGGCGVCHRLYDQVSTEERKKQVSEKARDQQDQDQHTGGYRIMSESGTHLATVSTAEEATQAREFYADMYQCIVTIVRTANKPQRW